MKHFLKIVALICVAAAVAVIGCSCRNKEEEKKVEFIPISGSDVISAEWQGRQYRDINNEESWTKIAEAYNSVTEFSDYDKEKAPAYVWKMTVVAVKEGGNPTIHELTNVGGNKVNVVVAGAASPGRETRYSVENEKLVTLVNDELSGLASVEAKVDVKYILSAGTYTELGEIRTEDEVISDTEQTVSGTELEPPTVSSVEILSVMIGAVRSYELSSDAKRVVAVNGYKEGAVEEESGNVNYSWVIALNGVTVPDDKVETTPVADGDVLTVTYVAEAAE